MFAITHYLISLSGYRPSPACLRPLFVRIFVIIAGFACRLCSTLWGSLCGGTRAALRPAHFIASAHARIGIGLFCIVGFASIVYRDAMRPIDDTPCDNQQKWNQFQQLQPIDGLNGDIEHVKIIITVNAQPHRNEQ